MLSVRRAFARNFGVFKRPNAIKVKTDIIKDLIESGQTKIEWSKVRVELIANEKFVNKSNLDGIIIRRCNQEVRLDIAKSYIDFLKSESMVINDATISNLLILYYRHHVNKCSVSEEDEKEIIKLSDSLLEKYDILDASLAESIVLALSLTKQWGKCLKLLDHIQVTTAPSTKTLCCIVSRALDEDRLDIAADLIDRLLSKQLVPSPFIIVKVFKKFQKNDAETEKFLKVLNENSVMLPEKILNELHEVLSESRDCKIVKLVRSGHCPSCSSNLPNIKLNESEFKKLSSVFLDNVIIRRDVFLKTNPEEVERFMKFLDISGPFDCVIDGLNVAFSHGNRLPAEIYAKNIASVVKYFTKRNDSCLVIGRKHMSKWPKDKMDFIRRNSSLFLAENISEDDPFLLYAALKSGSNTKIVSRDLMRGHSILLDNESKQLFRRWQQQQQYSVISFTQNDVLVKEPIGHELRVHKVGSNWHLPFTSENHSFTYDSFEIPSSWLCLKVNS